MARTKQTSKKTMDKLIVSGKQPRYELKSLAQLQREERKKKQKKDEDTLSQASTIVDEPVLVDEPNEMKPVFKNVPLMHEAQHDLNENRRGKEYWVARRTVRSGKKYTIDQNVEMKFGNCVYQCLKSANQEAKTFGGSKKTVGLMQEVYDGVAHHTKRGVTVEGLCLNRYGKVTSKKKQANGLKATKNISKYKFQKKQI